MLSFQIRRLCNKLDQKILLENQIKERETKKISRKQFCKKNAIFALIPRPFFRNGRFKLFPPIPILLKSFYFEKQFNQLV